MTKEDKDKLLSTILDWYNSGREDHAEFLALVKESMGAAFAAGQAEMRERAASAGFSAASSDENACEVSAAIRALPIGEN